VRPLAYPLRPFSASRSAMSISTTNVSSFAFRHRRQFDQLFANLFGGLARMRMRKLTLKPKGKQLRTGYSGRSITTIELYAITRRTRPIPISPRVSSP
jgi:hypothetical protein